MKDSKLIVLLKSLDATAFKRLHLFLQSPYYNRNQQVTELYLYLSRYYPGFHSSRIQKEMTHRNLFPDQSFDLNRMRKLMSALTKLVEAYLLTLELELETYNRKKLLVGLYKRRNLFPLYGKGIQDLIAELDAAPSRTGAYYYEQSSLNQELFFHPETDKHEQGYTLLVKAMDNLDRYYTLTKLQLGAEMCARENILEEKYSMYLFEEITRESRMHFAVQNPIIQLYLHIIDLHRDSTEATSLAPALALFKTLLPTISLQEQQTVLYHLINCCVRRINQGKTEHKQTLFELYQLGLEYTLLLENNQITEITFSNIVSTGTSLKVFDWTRDFIDQYAPYLKDEIRDDIKALSLAYWHFNKKAYDQAERALLGHKFSDVFNLLKSRCLLIRTYFEQYLQDDSNYFFLIDQIDAFEKFIRRQKKIARNKVNAYLNFIKFTRKLATIKYNRKDTSVLKQQLGGQTAVSYKEWLLEKMEPDQETV